MTITIYLHYYILNLFVSGHVSLYHVLSFTYSVVGEPRYTSTYPSGTLPHIMLLYFDYVYMLV